MDRDYYGFIAAWLIVLLAIVIALAVAVFFGPGYGLIAMAAFIVAAIACVLAAIKRTGR